MNKIVSNALIITSFIYGLQLTACSKSTDENKSSTTFTIPNVTGAVATTTTQSLITQNVSSVIQNSSNILVGGTAPADGQYARFPFFAGMMHFTLTKIPDAIGCLVEVLVSKSLVSTDGKEYLFTDSDDGSKTKIVVNANGNKLSNFKIYHCTAASSQTQYTSGELVGEDAVFTFKNIDGSNKSSLTVTGKYNGSAWTSKTVTINALSSGSYSTYKTTQYADALISQYSTQDSSGLQLYSKYALSGSSIKDYAMGAGSIMGSVTSNVVYHWNVNLANTTAASPFSADVSSGAYLSIPNSSTFTAHDLSGTDIWNCQTGSATVLDGTNVTAIQYQEVSQGVQSCMAGL